MSCNCQLCREARQWEEYGHLVGDGAGTLARDVLGALAVVGLAVLLLVVWPVL